MKTIAINGSPRKGHNTEALLQQALEGAASCGFETELIHLSELRYRGCCSCFACKRLDCTEHRCTMRDELTDVLQKSLDADILLIGAPVYFFGLPSGLTAYLERLLFPAATYDTERPTFYKKRIRSGFIYSMNSKKEMVDKIGSQFSFFEIFAAQLLRELPDRMLVYNTLQYDDYSKYEHNIFPLEDKLKQRETQWPKDLKDAWEFGELLAKKALR